jgi:hypothetical protein
LARVRTDEGAASIEVFSVEWIRWMCGLCEDLRISNDENMSLLWMQTFSYGDGGDDSEDESDDDEEEEEEEGDSDGWLFEAHANEYMGRTVRCYPLSDDYWDEGLIVGYLPPTEEEPMALWKVKGVRKGVGEVLGLELGAEEVADKPSTDSSSSSSSSSVEINAASIVKPKMWSIDLEEQELLNFLI